MYVFVDLETTGLDAQQDYVLEMGIGVYTDELAEDRSIKWSTLIIPDFSMNYLESQMDDFVLNMHKTNGILDSLRAAKEKLRQAPEFELAGFADIATAQVAAVEFLKSVNCDQQPMAGSTINFDRSFLEAHAPYLNSFFHYHNYDVTTLGMLHEKYKGYKYPETMDRKIHRVLPDIEDSAAKLKWLLNEMGWING